MSFDQRISGFDPQTDLEVFSASFELRGLRKHVVFNQQKRGVEPRIRITNQTILVFEVVFMFLPQKSSKILSKQDMVVGTRETGTEKATKPVESHPIRQGDLFIQWIGFLGKAP